MAATRIHNLIDGKPPTQLAIIDHDGAEVSFGDLRSMAEECAETLRRHGVRGGDRVLLVAENCALFAVVIFALSRLDAWVTLINARQSDVEIDAIIAHSGARCLIFTSHCSEAAQKHADNYNATRIGALACGPLDVTATAQQKPEPVLQGPEQVAALMYTTGTTHAPKGVMLSHGNLIFNAHGAAAYNNTRPEDRILAVLPGTHIYGLGSLFLPAMFAGASVRFVTRFFVENTIEHLRNGISVFPGVPQMFAAIAAHLQGAGQSLNAPRLNRIATGGAPLDPELKTRAEACFGLALQNGYGMTEASPTISLTRRDSRRDDTSVGYALPGVSMKIDAPDRDGIGEILLSGRNIMKGYYRDPDRTAEVTTPDGYFRTGDLGRMDPDGALHIVGRTKELIIRSGFNVYPPEIEAMLTRHPQVTQAAVIGRAIAGNEEIIAFVMTSGKTTEAALRLWITDQLVGYKVPQHILIVSDFPRAATGKVLKHKLATHFASELAIRDATTV